MSHEPLSDLERELWRTVEGLWDAVRRQDRALVGQLLHPQYVGWEVHSREPHGRDEALESAVGGAASIEAYSLEPLSVVVYEGTTGVTHYTYRATVRPPDGARRVVAGRWTEVFVRSGNGWRLAAVHGGPERALALGDEGVWTKGLDAGARRS